MTNRFDDGFHVPSGWVVAEVTRTEAGRVMVEAPGLLQDEAFKVRISEQVTEFARSMSSDERLADVFRVVVSPEGDAVEVQMADIGLSVGIFSEAWAGDPSQEVIGDGAA